MYSLMDNTTIRQIFFVVFIKNIYLITIKKTQVVLKKEKNRGENENIKYIQDENVFWNLKVEEYGLVMP